VILYNHSVIIPGQKHHLGDKALFFMLLQYLSPAFFLFFLVIIISVAWDSLSQGFINSEDVLGQFPFIGNTSISSLMPSFILIIVFMAIFFAGIGALIALLKYRFLTFTVEEFGLRLKRGIFNIEEITIPYRQMQNVDIVRNLLYRIFGISELIIMSAGHDEDPTDEATTSTVFNPIDRVLAEELSRLLGRRIGVQIIEDTERADKEDEEAEIISKVF